ncbi:uncharacterized protein J3D65DRAFT_675798 [Phyllosticta citribraziliensis]|uniref:Uncharacterized protein n=1 Tax=Phyllosticta citribraziliensis TaxID=989973 RepID=A0ABR1M0W0_9PEZI
MPSNTHSESAHIKWAEHLPRPSRRRDEVRRRRRRRRLSGHRRSSRRQVRRDLDLQFEKAHYGAPTEGEQNSEDTINMHPGCFLLVLVFVAVLALLSLFLEPESD